MCDKSKALGLSLYSPQDFNQYDFGEWFDLPVADGQQCIRTVRQRIRIPEVVVNKYTKVPRRTVKYSRMNLWKRDNHVCQYCGCRPAPDEITIDHVLPRSRGGKSVFTNAVLACISCNKKKADRTPEEAGMRLRRTVRNKRTGLLTVEFYHRPTVPSWSPLFALKRRKVPRSWSNFLQQVIDDLYWNSELEE